jgi:hypothetical protein
MHKLTKLKSVENPSVQTADSHDEYRASKEASLFRIGDNHLSPNVDYWVVGDIINPPSIGEGLIMDRWVRNGQFVRGRFSTSSITSITDDGFETMNSVYKLEEVDDDEILELTSLNTSLS